MSLPFLLKAGSELVDRLTCGPMCEENNSLGGSNPEEGVLSPISVDSALGRDSDITLGRSGVGEDAAKDLSPSSVASVSLCLALPR